MDAWDPHSMSIQSSNSPRASRFGSKVNFLNAQVLNQSVRVVDRGKPYSSAYVINTDAPLERLDIAGAKKPDALRGNPNYSSNGKRLTLGVSGRASVAGGSYLDQQLDDVSGRSSFSTNAALFNNTQTSDIYEVSKYHPPSFHPKKVITSRPDTPSSKLSSNLASCKKQWQFRSISKMEHELNGTDSPTGGRHRGKSVMVKPTQTIVRDNNGKPTLRTQNTDEFLSNGTKAEFLLNGANEEDLKSGKVLTDGARQVSSTLQVFEENHAAQLAAYFGQLYMHDQLTDIMVHVGSYTFSAHKTMLCCFSPFLAKRILFTPDSRDLYLGENITPTGFKKILDYIYTKELSIEAENLAEIMQAANILEMAALNRQCLNILETSDGCTLLNVFETAHRQRIQGLIEDRVLPKVCAKFFEIYESAEFCDLCSKCLCKILKRDDLVVCCEREVAAGAFGWIKYNKSERLDLVEYITPHVRLVNMTSEDIIWLGREFPFLMENENIRENLLKAHWNKNSDDLLPDDKIEIARPRKYFAPKRVGSDGRELMHETSPTLSAKSSAQQQQQHQHQQPQRLSSPTPTARAAAEPRRHVTAETQVRTSSTTV